MTKRQTLFILQYLQRIGGHVIVLQQEIIDLRKILKDSLDKKHS